MKQIKGESNVKRKDEYIDMGTVYKMREYAEFKKAKALENQ